jgi:hypothetical protein
VVVGIMRVMGVLLNLEVQVEEEVQHLPLLLHIQEEVQSMLVVEGVVEGV